MFLKILMIKELWDKEIQKQERTPYSGDKARLEFEANLPSLKEGTRSIADPGVLSMQHKPIHNFLKIKTYLKQVKVAILFIRISNSTF